MTDHADKSYLRRGRIARLILAWLTGRAHARCPESANLKHGIQFRVEDGLTLIEPAPAARPADNVPGSN